MPEGLNHFHNVCKAEPIARREMVGDKAGPRALAPVPVVTRKEGR